MAGEAVGGPFIAPNDYAVVVGINRYRTGIDTLQGAVNDATLFREWLISPTGGGLNPDNVELIISPDQGDFDPSREEIENAIYVFYERNQATGREVGRRLYLFLAGHGVAPGDGEDCSLIAANSFLDPYRVLTGRLTADRVLKQPLFKEVVLFMACCRDVNGSAVFSGLPEAGQPLPDSTFLHGLAVKWAKRAIEKQLPHPFDPAQPLRWQSVFSHALLKGLTSALDANGKITSLSLRDFVKQQVQALLPPDDNRPPKFFLDEDSRPIVFKDATAAAIVPPGPGGPRGLPGAPANDGPPPEPPPPAAESAPATSGLIPVEIALSGGANTVEILDGTSLAKLDLHPEQIATGKFKVYLKPSLYAFRIPGRPPTPVRILGEAVSVTI